MVMSLSRSCRSISPVAMMFHVKHKGGENNRCKRYYTACKFCRLSDCSLRCNRISVYREQNLHKDESSAFTDAINSVNVTLQKLTDKLEKGDEDNA